MIILYRYNNAWAQLFERKPKAKKSSNTAIFPKEILAQSGEKPLDPARRAGRFLLIQVILPQRREF